MIVASSAVSIGSSQSQLYCLDSPCCSTSSGIITNRLRTAPESGQWPIGAHIRLKNPIFGPIKFHQLHSHHDYFHWRVSVAADYSDSLPDSSNYTHYHRYHPLEDVKASKRFRNTKLTLAELTRTTIEANNTALLLLPGSVHCEPHEQISWANFAYVVDDFGDIFFSIPDDRNILQDPGAANVVNALVAMDIPIYGNKAIPEHNDVFSMDNSDDIPFDEDYFVAHDSELPDVPADWVPPESSSIIHPVYFAKCLSKASGIQHERKMNHPSNGVSIIGCLRPAFADEESYIKELFGSDANDGYDSEWKDRGFLRPKSSDNNVESTLYRLDIMKIELFSVYGTQAIISLQEFQDAEPDALARSVPAILEQFSESGAMCTNAALKALCKKKGLYVEEATLIGVDSLGIDVRVCCGVEVRTHRFPFKTQATNEVTAEKQIQQLLFPRSRRKKFSNGGKDAKSF